MTRKLRKTDLCDWICRERRNADDFEQFDLLIVPLLCEFVEMAE